MALTTTRTQTRDNKFNDTPSATRMTTRTTTRATTRARKRTTTRAEKCATKQKLRAQRDAF
eukprot:2189879-Pleurochrysis_carterae.AAC.3